MVTFIEYPIEMNNFAISKRRMGLLHMGYFMYNVSVVASGVGGTKSNEIKKKSFSDR